MERLNHHWADHVDYVEGHGQDDWQEGKEQEFRLRRYEIFDPDYDEEDYDEEDYDEEDYDEAVQDEVEHRTDGAADDVDKADFHAQFRWRSKMRHRRGRGRFVPPDTRGLVAPVFVRRANPGAKAEGGPEEESESEHE